MTKEHMILLHGALGAAEQYIELREILNREIQTHTLDFEGHGLSELKGRFFRLPCFAENVIEYLDQHDIETVHIFGHSLGGHTGMYLARFFPDRVASVFTFGMKFIWSPEIAEKENAMLIPAKMLEKVPTFAETLKNRHQATGWIELVNQVKEMHTFIGTHPPISDENISEIKQPVRLGLGDRDKMVSIEETVHVFRLLTRGELQVFPQMEHPLEKAPKTLLAKAILEFIVN